MNPPAAARCRVCAAALPAGATRCPNCSAAVGPLDPCPHCRAVAGIAPHPELRWVCEVCGGPRVPRLDPSITYGGREAPPLRRADAARKARALWRGGAIASGLVLPFVLFVAAILLLVFGVTFAMVTLSLLAVAPVAAFLAFAVRRAGARGHEIAPALDAAWLAAATAIAQQSQGAVTAAVLSEKLGIEEPQAEELMALLDVNEAVAGPRMRIGTPPAPAVVPPTAPAQVAGATAPAAGPPTQVASAEEEAALLEQAEAEAEAAAQRKGSA